MDKIPCCFKFGWLWQTFNTKKANKNTMTVRLHLGNRNDRQMQEHKPMICSARMTESRKTFLVQKWTEQLITKLDAVQQYSMHLNFQN